jgi:protein SCO1/2
MAEYSSHFHSRLVALTGTPEQITQTASVFRIFFGRVSEPEETDCYLMEHSSVIYVIGPDGKYVAHFTHATPMDKMVQRLREIL